MQRRNGSSNLSGGGRRHRIVMVVDQDERILKRLTEKLKKYGFETVAASTYDEALEVLGMLTPDVIISEVNFANGSAGFDLFFWVRSIAGLHKLPFMFLATKIDREVLIAGKRLGVDDFLTKPLDDDVVAASISNCLNRAQRT
jgi:DNA-binding response OmpR family regulator